MNKDNRKGRKKLDVVCDSIEEGVSETCTVRVKDLVQMEEWKVECQTKTVDRRDGGRVECQSPQIHKEGVYSGVS